MDAVAGYFSVVAKNVFVVPDSKSLIAWTPSMLSAVFIVASSIRIQFVGEIPKNDKLFSTLDTQNINYHFALVGSIAMTFPLFFSLFLEYHHAFTSPDKAKSLQTTLQAITVAAQSVFLLTVLIPSCILLSTHNRSAYWVLANIQVHNLVQAGYSYVNATCNRDVMSWKHAVFPVILLVGQVLHLEAMFVEGTARTLLVAGSALCTLVLIVATIWSLLSLREHFDARRKDQLRIHPEERLSMIYLVILSVWLFAYLVFHASIVRSNANGIDYCTVHMILVGCLAYALCVCNSVKTKEAAAMAEAALDTKRVFVRHVSHEIRTPLNTTIMGMGLVKEELQKPYHLRDESMLADLIMDINSSTVTAVEILNDLLLYEKIEGGLVSLDTEDVMAWDIVKEVLRVFRIQAKSSQINLDYPDSCCEGYFVSIDKTKLSQVLRNLVSNALKFTSPNGRVSVTATIHKSVSSNEPGSRRRTSIRAMKFVESVFPSKEFVRISVADTGVGISKEDQRRLFREIVQFDPVKLQKGQGSGLGLWISSRIVRLHGGKIGVISEGNGSGSIFYIDLPISKYFMDHPLSDIISESMKQNYAELFTPGQSASSIQTSFIHASTKSNSTTRTFSSKQRRSLQLEHPPEPVMESSNDDIENSPVKSPARLRGQSGDSVNSFLIMNSTPPATPGGGKSSPKRSRGSSLTVCAVPELDASPLGSMDAADSKDEEDYEQRAAMIAQQQQRRAESEEERRTAEYQAYFKRRILIVDDAVSNRKVVNRLLRNKIESRDEAVNGAEACRMVEESMATSRTYDCILMDYYMPVMDGPTATVKIREMGFKGVIIGVTGNGDSVDILKFRESGADHVLVKPLDADRFWKILTEQLGAMDVGSQV